MDRDWIIAEIRRTAAENRGTPLGKLRFLRETGITESDWSGRYWARWSDALAEAGFPPNSLQGPYDQLPLLKRLVEVIQAFGKWPTEAELKLHVRTHPGFPSPNTFRRLGTRADQAELVLTRKNDLQPGDDVLEICRALKRSVESKQQDDRSVGFRTRGFVYLLKSGRYHKIGHSNDPSRRAYELRLQLPEQLKMLHRIETDDPEGIEAYWHRRFADKRANGEWFALSPADIAAFKARTSM